MIVAVVLVVRIMKTPLVFFVLNAFPHGPLQHDKFISSKPSRERESIKSSSKTEIINSCNLILTGIPHNLCRVLWFRSKLQVFRPTHDPGEKITKGITTRIWGSLRGQLIVFPVYQPSS